MCATMRSMYANMAVIMSFSVIVTDTSASFGWLQAWMMPFMSR